MDSYYSWNNYAPVIEGWGDRIALFSICLTTIKNWSTGFILISMWSSNKDISGNAVTIFSITEAMLLKLQVPFKNYLRFSVENKSTNRGMEKTLKSTVLESKTATIW